MVDIPGVSFQWILTISIEKNRLFVMFPTVCLVFLMFLINESFLFAVKEDDILCPSLVASFLVFSDNVVDRLEISLVNWQQMAKGTSIFDGLDSHLGVAVLFVGVFGFFAFVLVFVQIANQHHIMAVLLQYLEQVPCVLGYPRVGGGDDDVQRTCYWDQGEQ